MNTNGITRFAQECSVSAFLSLIDHASDKDIEKLLSALEVLTRGSDLAQAQIPAIRKAWQEDYPTTRLIKRGLRELNPRVRRELINNVVLNSSYGPTAAVRGRLAEKENFRPPFTMLISPTMRCNLRCPGCYAGEYTQSDDLPIDVIDRLLKEGKEMGIYAVTILGGEPFIRRDLWEIYEKHPDVEFMVFTNGCVLTPQNVDRIADLGNIAPMISLEGFKDETDARRGTGTFDRIMTAMDDLRQAGVLFGFSSMVTRQNVDTICGDAFNDMLVKKGCYLGWHFLYMPIGRDPQPELMPTPEQREYMRLNGAARIRSTRPLFVIDFWNDAPHVGGCIAGGKEYFHINSQGDVEPCIFTHFATDNIKVKSLRQALESPFFKGIQARQPFNQNLLLPCQLIDNPQAFREVYATYHPYATHPGAESMVNELKPSLNAYAQCVQGIMAPAWQHDYVEKGAGHKAQIAEAEASPA